MEERITRAKQTQVDLAVNVGGLYMSNPVTVASGTFSSGKEFSHFIDVAELGAVTTKGVSLHGWEGNDSPRIAETPSGMLNSIGLQNPGVEHLRDEDIPWLREAGARIIVNVSGHSPEEYAKVIEALEDAPVDAYEINISCPNVDKGGMVFGCSREGIESVLIPCREVTKRPIIAKLTPNVTDIAEMARIAEACGADALSMINTVLAMAVNARTRKAELARVVGGLSGPAIKPIALRCVWQAYNAVNIPIIGMGGISNGTDAIEFMLAGATAVAVGTANFVHPSASIDVLNSMIDYCEEQGVSAISELTGGLQC